LKTKHLLRGAAALLAISVAPFAFAADHLDAPGVKTDASTDITDVYTWNDGTNVALILNVSPLAATGAKFSNAAKYVLHTASKMKYTDTTETETDVICTFDATQKISCWVVSGGATKDYVTGDASATAGITSASGKVKVFAGPRDDPFFFNLGGFKDAEVDVEAATGVTTDAAGCPNNLPGSTVTKLDNDLGGSAHGTAAAVDFFKGKNVLSIVLSVDKTLLTTGGPLVAVWGSTNQ